MSIVGKKKRSRVKRVLYSLNPNTIERFNNLVSERERSKTVNALLDEYLDREENSKDKKLNLIRASFQDLEANYDEELAKQDSDQMQKEVWDDILKKYL